MINIEKFKNLQNLFDAINRRKLFMHLMKRIIKISNKDIKSFDILVHDFLISELRRNFSKHKSILNLEEIKENFYQTEKILEDLENMIESKNPKILQNLSPSKMSERKLKNLSITQCNYLVNN
jgi:hypothetical protein